MKVEIALAVLARAGFSVSEPMKPFRAVSIATAAARMECSQEWVRRNLDE